MGLLDETKLDWGNPDAVQLRTYLVEIFTLHPPIFDLAGIARLDRGMIVWEGRPLDKWSRVLERAAEESKMRALLDAVLANGLTANHAELRGLIQRLQSAEPTPQSTSTPTRSGYCPPAGRSSTVFPCGPCYARSSPTTTATACCGSAGATASSVSPTAGT